MLFYDLVLVSFVYSQAKIILLWLLLFFIVHKNNTPLDTQPDICHPFPFFTTRRPLLDFGEMRGWQMSGCMSNWFKIIGHGIALSYPE